MGFPEQLKKARLNKGYTQQQVADLMQISKSTYCGYETGKRQPDVFKIKQLSNILNTSGDILLETNLLTSNQNSVIDEITKEKSEILKKIQKMSDNEVKAVLAFVNTLDSIKIQDDKQKAD